MDYSLPGSSVHGILQARLPGWIALFFSRGSSQLRDQTQISRIAGRFLYRLRHQGSPKPCAVAIQSHKRPEASQFQERIFFLPQIQAKTDKFPLPCFYARGWLSIPSSFQSCTPLPGARFRQGRAFVSHSSKERETNTTRGAFDSANRHSYDSISHIISCTVLHVDSRFGENEPRKTLLP